MNRVIASALIGMVLGNMIGALVASVILVQQIDDQLRVNIAKMDALADTIEEFNRSLPK